jgi:predicted RNase H-like HicB family nuclease
MLNFFNGSDDLRLEFVRRVPYILNVQHLEDYQKAALKLARLKKLGPSEGYSAKIPGFAGLVVFGGTKLQALSQLASALEGWIQLSLQRGEGLPALPRQPKELISVS